VRVTPEILPRYGFTAGCAKAALTRDHYWLARLAISTRINCSQTILHRAGQFLYFHIKQIDRLIYGVSTSKKQLGLRRPAPTWNSSTNNKHQE
jgi:hypothetical protein